LLYCYQSWPQRQKRKGGENVFGRTVTLDYSIRNLRRGTKGEHAGSKKKGRGKESGGPSSHSGERERD